ncbi:galactose-1-phosphate uridylyltransferase [Demequina oxidasica]|uniref:galactose-1-phosphate uridylyltransferase n=1 Tax=Demequina oxidasica TaxID=676199 RepID=UPI000780F1E0|nr:galactose-1-phosphate uridylyltransferase [Demequina oxidasica]
MKPGNEEIARDKAIRVSRDHLADGREIIYFDDRGATLPTARKADSRTLDPRPATANARQDPLTGEWISVAAARQNRVMLPPAHLDPLAPQSPTNPSEVPDNYDVAVFENRSPSFGPQPTIEGVGFTAAIGLERTAQSAGRCEVVCFSPEHDGSFASLGDLRARTVIEAWAHRTAELSKVPAVKQVFPFENRGEAIGVTLHHPHGQIYSYPYVTPRTQRLQASVADYGQSLMSDILDREREGGRVLIAGEYWTAFVPFAARWPVEIHVLPHRDVPDFAHTSLEERDELASLYPRLLRGVDALYDTPTPYIGAWHQAPLEGGDGIRLMAQVTSPRRAADKLKFLAGSEAAMGAWIADVSPEVAAENLREAIARADASAAQSSNTSPQKDA